MRRLALISVALAFLASHVVVAAAGLDFAEMEILPYDPPKPAPAFALPDLDGKTVRLEDQRGKVTLLFFWTTW